MRLFAIGLAAAAFLAAQEPTRVFMSHCMSCHSPNSGAHAPMPEAMAGIPWQDVLKTLESGSMKVQGDALIAEERVAVARYLGSSGPAVIPEMTGFCAPGAKPAASKWSWNGWSPDNQNTRFQPADAAGLDASNLKTLDLKWAFGFPTGTSAFGQPSIADGRVITGSNDGTVYALDAHSGCLYWRYQAKTLVRAAVVVGPGPRAYFGDLESNAYAVDANTGKLIWQKKLDDQPFARITGSPKLYDGKLYVPIASQEENAGSNPQYPCCKFRGNVVALDARTGAIVWRSYTTPEPGPTKVGSNGVQYYGPSGATVWSSPTIDLKRKLLYVATGNGYSDPDIKTADAVVKSSLQLLGLKDPLGPASLARHVQLGFRRPRASDGRQLPREPGRGRRFRILPHSGPCGRPRPADRRAEVRGGPCFRSGPKWEDRVADAHRQRRQAGRDSLGHGRG